MTTHGTTAYAARLNVLLTHDHGVLSRDEEAAVRGLLAERETLLAGRRELTALLEKALVDLARARDDSTEVWLAERNEELRAAVTDAARLLARLSGPGPCDVDGDGACRGHAGFASGYLEPCPHPAGRRFAETWGTRQGDAQPPVGPQDAPQGS